MGKERKKRGMSVQTDAERERERQGVGERDCVKCDRVLEPLEQLGSSPAPGFQLLTFRGDSVAAERPLPRLTLQPLHLNNHTRLLHVESHFFILASMTTFTQTSSSPESKRTASAGSVQQ